MQSIDPIKQSGPNMQPPRPRAASSATLLQNHESQVKPPQTGARFTKLQSGSHKKRRSRGVLIAVVVSPILLGLALGGVVSMCLVAFYGVFVVVRRLNSRLSFTLALCAFVYMFALQLVALSAWAQTEAALAYILLAIGALRLAIETRHSREMWSKQQ
jgi:hypothetical protein